MGVQRKGLKHERRRAVECIRVAKAAASKFDGQTHEVSPDKEELEQRHDQKVPDGPRRLWCHIIRRSRCTASKVVNRQIDVRRAVINLHCVSLYCEKRVYYKENEDR